MGLDMYLKGKKSLFKDYNNPDNDFKEDGYEVDEIILNLGYWRKHPNLHGWIVQEFAKGVDDCEPIYLGEEEINQILEAIRNDKLEPTTGFFFGNDPTHDSTDPEMLEWYKEQKAEDISIFMNALAWLKSENHKKAWRSVEYRASW